MPGEPGLTNQWDRVTSLWTGSWIAALVVGVIVWGLTLWAVVAYRRRKDDPEFPDQMRYNVPLEVLYTVVPLIMVGVLFYFTARDQAEIESLEQAPDIQIEAIGKQWSWDFNYLDEDTYESGIQVPLSGGEADEELAPTLYLPVGESVRFTLHARDVIHSFWIPQFLYKKDMIPGRTNYWQVTPQKTGEFQGKCAELCGEFHSEMLFNVKVVEREEFDAHMQDLREKGQEGRLPVNLGRSNTDQSGQDN